MSETVGAVEQYQLAKERGYWVQREALQAELVQEIAGDDEEKAMAWIDRYAARFAQLVDPADGDTAIVRAIIDGRSDEARELIKQKLYGATERPAA